MARIKDIDKMPLDLIRRGKLISKDIERAIPRQIGKTVRFEFAESFDLQRFNDSGTTTWKKPQRATPGTKAYEYATSSERSRKTLFGAGSANLRNSLEYAIKGVRRVVIQTDVPYARYHNEGISPQPKRMFMGYSRQAMKKAGEEIDRFIDKDMLE